MRCSYFGCIHPVGGSFQDLRIESSMYVYSDGMNEFSSNRQCMQGHNVLRRMRVCLVGEDIKELAREIDFLLA